MDKLLMAAKWVLPVSGLLVVALGVALLFTGLDGLSDWAIFIGLAMILSGISELAAFKKRDKDRRPKSMVFGGLIAILLGGYIVVGVGHGLLVLDVILPIVFAAWVITASIPRIKEALIAREDGSPWWVFMLSFGLLGIALGVLMLFFEPLSNFVVTYALAFIFIVHGANAVIMFAPIRRKTAEKDQES